MQTFLRFSLVFFVAALCLTTIVRGTTAHLPGVLGFALATVKYMGAGPWVIGCLPLLAFFGWKHPDRLKEAMIGFIATLALVSAYTMIKSTIPTIVPFWADEMLAVWDRSLHGGVDPWVLAHGLREWVDTDGAAFTYSGLWGAFAFSFPVLLALSDQDHARKARYLALYALSWVVLGNGVAVGFASVGPIYSDAVTGTNAFAPMVASLADLTFPGTSVERVQTGLWDAYVADNGAQLAGAGISAFPSMHVAIAAVIGLYVAERNILFAPIGAAYWAVILFLSVYTGWHYAVDGYASSIGVVALYIGICAFQRHKVGQTQRKSHREIDPTLA